MRNILMGIVLSAVCLSGCGRENSAARVTPVLNRTIPLPGVHNTRPTAGVPGRIDHLGYDPKTDRLFVAALENGTLEVIDLAAGARIKSIGPLGRPQGIAVLPDHNRAAVACGDGSLHVYDTRTLDEVKKIDVGRGADNVRYDAKAHRVYVSHGDQAAGGIAVLDGTTWQIVRDIPYAHRPESFRLDPKSPRLFANVPGGLRATSDGVFSVVDRETGKVLSETTLTGLARNYPMSYDAEHQRVYVASRKPPVLAQIDARTSAVAAQASCSEDSDDLFYDEKSNCVFVIGGGYRPDMQDPPQPPAAARPDETGAIDVFSADSIGDLKLVGQVRTAPHARTGLLVPERRAIYVAVPPRDGADAEIREYWIGG